MPFDFKPKPQSKIVILPEDVMEPTVKRRAPVPAPAPMTLSECLKAELDESKTRAVARRLVQIATDEDARASDSLTAIKLMFERTEGAPKSALDITVTSNPLNAMSSTELKAYLATLGLAAVSNDAVFEIENIAQAEGGPLE